MIPKSGTRFSDKIMPRQGIPGQRRKGSSRGLAGHDAMDFLAGGCTDRLVVEQHLGCAVDRLANERALESGVEPAVVITLVDAVGDAPAQVKNAVGLEDGEQAADRVEDLRTA